MRFIIALLLLGGVAPSASAQQHRAPWLFAPSGVTADALPSIPRGDWKTNAPWSAASYTPTYSTTSGIPTWVKWGLVGAGVGALAMPVLAGLGGDSQQRPVRDAAIGAVAGFVIVGGSVALWQAICGPESRSRRAGLCGR